MIDGKSYFCCGLPYQMGIKYGVTDPERIKDEMSDNDFDPISFAMEMECLPFGESSNAHFSFDELSAMRTIKNVFRPLNAEDFSKLRDKHGEINYKFKNPNQIPRKDGEIRIVSMDVALMMGANNDASCFTLIRAVPNGKSYVKFLDYIEVLEGEHSFVQANRLKQLYYDYDADIVVIDSNGNGMSIYDDLTKTFVDPERGTEYQAFRAFNDEKMYDRSYEKDALDVIYSVKTSGSNARAVLHSMHTYTKKQFESKRINIPMTELKIQELLQKEKKFFKMTSEEWAVFILPYYNTTRLVNEMINLEKKISGGLITLEETGSGRKDRYMSLAYALKYIQEQEVELKYKEDKNDQSDLEYLAQYIGF